MKSILSICLLLSLQSLTARHSFPIDLHPSLKPTSILVSGTVSDESGNPLSGINIYAETSFSSTATTSDGDGNFTLDLQDLDYKVYAGGWGYLTEVKDYASGELQIDFNLVKGYRDSFIFDFGWDVSGDAETGIWTREIPIGTDYNGWPCNPGSDSAEDNFGDFAFITGNGGGGAGNDDVDNGVTILRSPSMDLSEMTNPRIAFDLWFFNDGGQGIPNDEVEVFFVLADELIEAGVYDKSFPVWFPQIINPEDYLDDLSEINIEFHVADLDGTGHLVEAGIDNFFVFEGSSSTADLPFLNYSLSPNPFNDYLQISSEQNTNLSYFIYNSTGILISQKTNAKSNDIINTSHFKPGIYYIQFYGSDFQAQPQKLLKL